VDVREAMLVRRMLSGSPFLDRAAELARALTTGGHSAGGLLLVGTPDDEPWHFGAHLDDEARWSGVPELAPTWVRWNPPAGAPAHLSIGIERLRDVRGGQTLLVATQTDATELLLQRVSDARRHGALVLAVSGTEGELDALAHESLVVPADAPVGFDVTTHLVSVAAGEAVSTGRSGVASRLRDRLARALDHVAGPDGG
jgi:hypothetical protein